MSTAVDTRAWALTKSDRQHFEQAGYLLARRMFSPTEMANVRETFMSLADTGIVIGLFEPATGAKDPLARYPRIMHPHRRPDLPVGELALRTMLDRRIGDVLTALFGDEPVAAQSMYYFKPPGARGQALHQDNFYLRVAPGSCMAAWVAIDNADEENGTLMVVPKSQNLDVVCPETADMSVSWSKEFVRPPKGMHEVAVQLTAGDVLFFNGSLIHGSYPNTSQGRFRQAFICHYLPRASAQVARWYRPLLDFEGNIVDDIANAQGGGPCGVPETGARDF